MSEPCCNKFEVVKLTVFISLVDLVLNFIHQIVCWAFWRVGVQNFISQRLDNYAVDDLSTVCDWRRQVHQEKSLEQKVCWDPIKNGTGPELNQVEESKNDPVCQ